MERIFIGSELFVLDFTNGYHTIANDSGEIVFTGSLSECIEYLDKEFFEYVESKIQ